MLVIGLTGPSGAGKGEVAKLFAHYGLPVIDADAVYHALLVPPSPCLADLVARFGRDILAHDGTLDRRHLGRIAFSDPAALEELNRITHRYVMERIKHELEQLRKKETRAAILDAPQLFEAGADRLCTAVVAVLADRNERIERIRRRDGIDLETALRRMRAQKSDDYFRTHADYIIENDGAVEHLLPTVQTILQETGVLPS